MDHEQLCASFNCASDVLIDAGCLAGVGYDVVDAVSELLSRSSGVNLTTIWVAGRLQWMFL